MGLGEWRLDYGYTGGVEDRRDEGGTIRVSVFGDHVFLLGPTTQGHAGQASEDEYVPESE